MFSLKLSILSGISSDNLKEHGAQFGNEIQYGVRFKLTPSMSRQIWWDILVDNLENNPEFTNGQIL